MRLGALVIAMSLIGGSSLGARPTLDLHVSPAVSTAPATVRIRISVPPDAGNRALEIMADSDVYSRSSHVDLEGENAPGNIFLEYRNLPAGTYQVRGVLVNNLGKQVAIANSVLTIVGIGAD
jgi:hypothetical protein